MSWQRRLRHLALSQIRAIKERLDRIDAEMDDVISEREAREAALRELDAEVGLPPLSRSDPAAASPQQPPPSAQPAQQKAPATAEQTEIARAYRVLGIPEGSDLADVEAAYRKLTERCRSVDFPEGSEDRSTAEAIMARLDQAYAKLREVLNPTAGRFDKLEL